MTSRSKNAVRVYETEIEKSREESNWKKVVELAQLLNARSTQHESLAHFLIGEGKLEAHLDEWPPIKDNIERAQRELSEARGYLTLATDEAGIKAGVALDAHLLLGKLHYACGAYDEALKHYKLAELNTLTEKELPVRSLRIIAESYAIKGLCLEENAVPSSSSRYKQAEKEAEMRNSRTLKRAWENMKALKRKSHASERGNVIRTGSGPQQSPPSSEDEDIKSLVEDNRKVKVPRKRVANFTAAEKTFLTHLIKRKPIIESKLTDGKTNAKKQKAWELLTREFNCHTNATKRDTITLKRAWDNMKAWKRKSRTSDRGNLIRTGGGPQQPPPSSQDGGMKSLVEDDAPAICVIKKSFNSDGTTLSNSQEVDQGTLNVDLFEIVPEEKLDSELSFDVLDNPNSPEIEDININPEQTGKINSAAITQDRSPSNYIRREAFLRIKHLEDKKKMETQILKTKVRCFEVSSELSLLYLQRAAGGRAGPTLETALQRAPLMHVRAGRLHAAIDRYREMLSAVESAATQSLRLTLARQLAELLMRGVTGQVYKPPDKVPVPPTQGTLTRRREDHVSEGPWKPKKYAAINQFVPQNEIEEVVLVLVVGEAMAVRDAVLSQSAEFEAARLHALANALAIIDLLALHLLRWGHLPLLLESLERAMKFSFGCGHVWRQRALCTAAAAPRAQVDHVRPGCPEWNAGVRARGVMTRAIELLPNDAPLRLVGADTSYNMGWIEEGIELAEQALAIEEERDGPMLARCCLYTGIGYQMKAQKTNSRIDKDAANDTALKYLIRSVELDDNDHLAFYYLGLQYMHIGMLNEAMDACRACLSRRAECGGGLRLCCALWSCACAGRRARRSLAAAGLARAQFPGAAWPLQALAAAQLARGDADAALAAGRDLLALHTPPPASDALSDDHRDTPHSTRDAASLAAESAGAFVVERALSEGAWAGAEPRAHPHTPARAWLLLALACLRLDKLSAAAGCVSEAAALTPFSHLVLYTRGLVHAASLEWEEARQCFQNALAIHPTHVDSMLQLGSAYYALGWIGLAERWVRSAASLAPRRAECWRRLSLVLQARHEPHAAADAAAAALQLHPTAPDPHLPL